MKSFHEQSQLRAERNKLTNFRGDDCENCGANLYLTRSGKCVKCVNLSKGRKVSINAAKRKKLDHAEHVAAMAAHKNNIAYQAWR